MENGLEGKVRRDVTGYTELRRVSYEKAQDGTTDERGYTPIRTEGISGDFMTNVDLILSVSIRVHLWLILIASKGKPDEHGWTRIEQKELATKKHKKHKKESQWLTLCAFCAFLWLTY